MPTGAAYRIASNFQRPLVGVTRSIRLINALHTAVDVGGERIERCNVFTDEFRSRLADGKYTRWATDLDEDRLEALLWVVGEYGMRAPVVTRQLDQHVAEIDPADVGYARARFALDAIFMIVQGQHCSVGELTSQIEDVLRRVRSQP